MQNGKRVRHSLRVAAGVLGLIVSMAAAFFLTTYTGEGTYEAKSGGNSKTNLPLVLSFPEGVSPTNAVELTAKLNNTTTETITFHTLTLTTETPAFPKCGSEWLTITAKGAEAANNTWWQETIEGKTRSEGVGVGSFGPGLLPLLARKESEGGTHEGASVKLWLEFKASKTGTDQSACENIPVKVTGHIS